MKAKLNLTRDSKGHVVSLEYAGLKKQNTVNPIYKRSVSEAKKRSISFSIVEESVLKRKFSV
ncbi:hypothetical protein [Aequorivita antarctica]|uniref:Uncharacterized protein n=1 Tax=Aequorivita antarctica TaxID=153266 RepID=A0A5C6YYF0_9FLAO|nr:hypothetical protein [Aequorivita antarctica]TXD72720.1 hypothetical protein ESU54_10890 [Aequorivita antarctica]SRX74756.1 hypothetical protein AEQU3_01736 [Aequorivita antarctica]